jgi:CelD/BcsL family acetyltransferase involved in cellulose biosynthesis
MTWTIHPLPTAEAFGAHAAAWDTLQARVAGLPFLESGFIQPLLAAFGSGRELLALHGPVQAPTAAAILVKGRRGQWTTFQPSQLPLGAWLSAPGAALDPLAADLTRALPPLALAVGITQLDSLFHPRPADTSHWRSQDYIDTAWVDIDGPFDAYWEARGKNLRQNLRKQQKKLETSGIQTRLECLTTVEDVVPALAHYGRLEASGWKGNEGTAIAPGHPQYAFYLAMLQNFCRQGRARLYQYRFNNEVVAMDLCILCGDRIVILKTAYDEAHKAVSPSTLMRQQQFEQLFADAAAGGALRRIEFYGKVMEWHTRWTAHTRQIYHGTRYRWGWIQSLHRALARRQGAPAPAPEATAPPVPEASAS